MTKNLFELRNVSVHAKGKRILSDVELSIEEDESLALVGASGSGKTTLLSLFNALVIPTKGEVLYRGVPLIASNVTEHRRRIPFVFSEPVMLKKTIREELLLPFLYLPDRVQCSEAQMLSTLKDVALPASYLNKECSFLSSGEKKRVAIARAIIGNPEALLLDEPSSGLDIAVAAQVLSNVFSLKKTVIFSSHRLEDLRLATRIVLIKNGRIVEERKRISETELQEFLNHE